METLIRTENSDIPKPYETTVSLGEEDYYYVNDQFLNLDLRQENCARILNSLTLEDATRIIKTDNKEEIKKAFQYALCENKSAAMQLKEYQKSLNSANQGVDDTKEFYNNMMVQTVNVVVGIVVLLGGSFFYFNHS